MIIRTALLALAALAASTVHAEELQATVSGEASIIEASGFGPPSPFAISYMFNTSAAQLSQIEFGTPFGSSQSVLVGSVANFPVVNYTQTFDGLTTVSPQGMGHFNLDLVSAEAYQMFGSAFGSSIGGYGFDIDAEPVITQAQYMAFKDPLAEILALFTPTRLGGDAVASANGSEWFLSGSLTVSSTSVPVPTPEPIVLCIAGLLGLIAARARFVRSGRYCCPD